jgi:hypothetical protein
MKIQNRFYRMLQPEAKDLNGSVHPAVLNPNKYAKSSKFLSPPQADGVLRNFAPSGTDFAKAQNPRSKLRGIL